MLSPRRLKYLLLNMTLLLFTASAMICLLASIVFLLQPQSSYSLPNPLQVVLPSYLQAQNRGWWSGEPDYQAASAAGINKDEWNLLYHLGGNGPWVEKIDDVVEGGIQVPVDCEVDMVHMMSRHAERFPTSKAGKRMMTLLERVKATGIELKGALEFLNDWEYFTNEPGKHFEQLTTTGPYAGVLEAFTTGVKLHTRYGHLWNDTAAGSTTVWASECDRVIDTAKYFSAGFFGLDAKTTKLEIVSEDATRGGDTLTPGDTCLKYVEDDVEGHDYGYQMLYKYQETYLSSISKRLAKENEGFDFTDEEVYSMQEMCGFETTVRGSSQWCDVFTQEEWLSFEYARDIIHYYRAGPGNKYAKSMGWLWLNTTANLIAEGPESAGPLYFTFVHDGDIVPMLASLGLFEDAEDLPVTKIAADRKWKTSQITPMGGRILFERLTCSTKGSKDKEVYVRLNVNDGIVALEGCSDGPGSSCSLDGFLDHVKRRGEIGGDFRKTCGLAEDAPDRLTFLRQGKTKTEEVLVAEPKKEEKKRRFWGI